MKRIMPATCLDVKLSLQNKDTFSFGEIITAEPLPEKTVDMSNYLLSVMPDVEIEYLGRPSLLRLNKYRKFSPSSLFFQTVHECFENHYPIALRPEVLMHLIVNEVATTVNMYPEEYRHLFTSSNGRVRLDVRNDALRRGDQNSPWDQVLEQFGVELQKNVPGELMSSFLPGFSTVTAETTAATMVSFMNTVQKFYDFHTHTMCGLPQIRLLGQSDDYISLRESAERLAEPFEAHLGLYFRNLIPVLRKLEEQACGDSLDEQFWSSLYKFNSSSGTDSFNGWIAAFVNYVQTAPQRAYRDIPARSGGIEPKEDSPYGWMKEPSFRNKGIDVGSVPSQVSVAPFTWHYLGEVILMQFVGGVLGIDDVDGYATPALSYAVVSGD